MKTPSPPSSNRTLNWVANPGPQSALFGCPADIILYGGAAGGGKTDAAIVWAAQGWRYSGYRALILRRSFPELKRHIVPRATQLFHGLAKWNQQDMTYTFRTPDGGFSYIEFGYLDRDTDVEHYQGAQYARIAADESTRFTEYQIRNLLRFNRSSVPDIRRQLLLTTNPIGPGFGYHKLIFIQNRRPYELYDDARWASDNQPVGLTTCFIPARIYDNPVLLEQDPEYLKRLQAQEGPVAHALINGSWDEVSNLAVDFDIGAHTCPPLPLSPGSQRWVAIDWGKRDKAAAVWLEAGPTRVYAYRDYARPGREIKPFAYEVAEMCKGEGVAFCVLSHECFADHGLGQNLTQASQFMEVFDRYNIPVIRSDKDPEGRMLLIREFLRLTRIGTSRPELDYNVWVEKFNREGADAIREYQTILHNSIDPELPRLKFFTGSGGPGFGCPYLIQTLPLLTVDVNRPRQLAPNQDDHGWDALGYGLKAYAGLNGLSAEQIYRHLLNGRIPDSTLDAQLVQKEAETLAGDSGQEPAEWPVEPFAS